MQTLGNCSRLTGLPSLRVGDLREIGKPLSLMCVTGVINVCVLKSRGHNFTIIHLGKQSMMNIFEMGTIGVI